VTIIFIVKVISNINVEIATTEIILFDILTRICCKITWKI